MARHDQLRSTRTGRPQQLPGWRSLEQPEIERQGAALLGPEDGLGFGPAVRATLRAASPLEERLADRLLHLGEAEVAAEFLGQDPPSLHYPAAHGGQVERRQQLLHPYSLRDGPL